MVSKVSDKDEAEVNKLVDSLFRRKAGQLVSTLIRIFGTSNIDLAESVVQEAFLKACQTWPYNGIPDNPSAWLTTVAKNHALNVLKKGRKLVEKETEIVEWYQTFIQNGGSGFDLNEPGSLDDQLKMIFLCCNPILSPKAQICLTLKTVGGFSIGEIARVFLSSEEASRKILTRAKQRIRKSEVPFELPPPKRLFTRTDTVMNVLYAIFNEGYSAHKGEVLVRADLCNEAIRLTSLFLHDTFSHLPKLPTLKALLALMLLHSSRLPARINKEGNLILLADQDRSLWDKQRIVLGLKYLREAASGDEITTYHFEAHIAACHAVAQSYEESDWQQILSLYNDLFTLTPSPVVALNRVVALSMVRGPEAGLEALRELADDPLLQDYYLLPATFADFYRRLNRRREAILYYTEALALAGTQAEKRFLKKKVAECKR